MISHLDRELSVFDLPEKQVRKEHSAFPVEKESGKVLIRLENGGKTGEIPARKGETVLEALERAGLNPPARCRTGECGWCRSRLIEGRIDEEVLSGGLRQADRKFGYFHPCRAYPLTDLKIAVPVNPVSKRKK
jgi:ferredoxin